MAWPGTMSLSVSPRRFICRHDTTDCRRLPGTPIVVRQRLTPSRYQLARVPHGIPPFPYFIPPPRKQSWHRMINFSNCQFQQVTNDRNYVILSKLALLLLAMCWVLCLCVRLYVYVCVCACATVCVCVRVAGCQSYQTRVVRNLRKLSLSMLFALLCLFQELLLYEELLLLL